VQPGPVMNRKEALLKLAHFGTLLGNAAKRLKRDKCPGCGGRPEPFRLLCARCAAYVREGRK
jgi:hypothetical protein